MRQPAIALIEDDFLGARSRLDRALGLVPCVNAASPWGSEQCIGVVDIEIPKESRLE